MRKLIRTAAALAMLAAGALYAQDIAGSWQGTLNVGRGLRLIVEDRKVIGFPAESMIALRTE